MSRKKEHRLDSSRLPNLWGDKDPRVTSVALIYERQGLQRWTNDMVADLARSLNTTIWVICAEAGAFVTRYDEKSSSLRLRFDKELIERCWEENSWPIPLAKEFTRLAKILREQGRLNWDDPFTFSLQDEKVESQVMAGTLQGPRPGGCNARLIYG
jgi:hypothetical protein